MNRNITSHPTKEKHYPFILKCLVLAAVWGFIIPVKAQNSIEISGQMKETETGKNLMYCSVAVLNSADSLVTGGITNDKGYFSIPVPRGRYKLAFSFVGYVPDTVDIGPVNSSRFLGIYKMKKDAQALGEVEVKASSRESSIDKETQIVTEAMRKGAADAKDVLQKVPGLSYDRYNNTIAVDNSSQVVFLVDGVEKNPEYVKNLSPERLKKIEVIRNPGGRYGLEGYSAIINIILRKDYTGQELFVNNQLLFDPDQNDKSYLIPKNDLNINYNYSFKKLNLYAGVTNGFKNFALKTDNETRYGTGTEISEIPPDAKPNMFFHGLETNWLLGADYYINPRNTLSFETGFSGYPVSHEKTEQTLQTDVFRAGELTDSFWYKTATDNRYGSFYGSLFYVGKLSNKDRLDASFNYSDYHENNDNQTDYENAFWRNEQGTNRKHFSKLNIEYTHTFNKKVSLQAGYDNTWKKLDNRFAITGSNSATDTSYLFEQTETRNNLYGYLSWSVSKKIGLKAGMAAEYSHPVSTGQNHKYFIYQPYFDLKYTFSKSVSLKLMYRSYADYPTINQTNPFPSRLDPTTISIGNPGLSPSVVNKISLRLSIKQGLFSIEPYYHFSDNYISQTGRLRPDSLFEYTYDNIGHYSEAGIQANFNVHFGKRFMWQNSLRVYHSKMAHNGNENSFYDWFADSQLIFAGLKNNGVVVLDYHRAMGRNINALGYSRNNNDFWLLLVQQPFLKNRLNAMIGYVLPLNWGVNYVQENYAKTNGYEKYNYTDIGVLKNIFIIRLAYRFSKGKVIKPEKHLKPQNEHRGKGVF